MPIRDLDSGDLVLNFFDEASVADWKGHDLRQAHRIPNIDVLLLAIRKVSNRVCHSVEKTKIHSH